MSILNYFKMEETPSECIDIIDKNNEMSLQLTSTEVECVVTELKSVGSKGK